jgi:hypothetical protein
MAYREYLMEKGLIGIIEKKKLGKGKGNEGFSNFEDSGSDGECGFVGKEWPNNENLKCKLQEVQKWTRKIAKKKNSDLAQQERQNFTKLRHKFGDCLWDVLFEDKIDTLRSVSIVLYRFLVQNFRQNPFPHNSPNPDYQNQQKSVLNQEIHSLQAQTIFLTAQNTSLTSDLEFFKEIIHQTSLINKSTLAALNLKNYSSLHSGSTPAEIDYKFLPEILRPDGFSGAKGNAWALAEKIEYLEQWCEGLAVGIKMDFWTKDSGKDEF